MESITASQPLVKMEVLVRITSTLTDVSAMTNSKEIIVNSRSISAVVLDVKMELHVEISQDILGSHVIVLKDMKVHFDFNVILRPIDQF